MKILKEIIFLIIILLVFIVITELLLSVIFYWKHKEVSFLIKNIVYCSLHKKDAGNNINVYGLPWDFKKDRMRPGKYVTNEGVEYAVNSIGFRGKEFDPLNKSKYRIICFGGSSTLGLESGESDTYPAILEHLLVKSGISAEVLNFGQSSKSLDYIEKLLFREAIGYKPDLITIYSNRNTALYDSSSSYYKTNDIIRSRMGYVLYRLHDILYENLMIYRALFCVYRKTAVSLKTADIDIGKQKINEAFFRDVYVQKLERIIETGKLNGFKVCLIKQPLLLNPSLQRKIKDYPVDKLIEMLKDKDIDIYMSKAYPNDNYMSKFWILTSAILNKQLDNIKKKHEEVILVDPINEFLGEDINYEELFHDYVHLTPKGNNLLAGIIYRSIKPIVRITTP